MWTDSLQSSRTRRVLRRSCAPLGVALLCACGGGATPREELGVTTQPLSNVGKAVGCSATGSCYAGLLGGPGASVPLPPKTLALTIDDGPGDFGAGIASYLAGLATPIRAAFFDNGNRFVTSADLPNTNSIAVTVGANAIVAQILSQGHIVGNHTVTHRDMATEVLPAGSTQVFRELAETDADLAGYVPSGFYLFRSPYGDFNPTDYSELATTAMNKYVGPVYWDIGGVSTNYPSQAADWACWQGQITCGSVNAGLGCPSVGALAYGTGYLTTKQCGDAYVKEIAAVGRGIILTHDPYSWASGNTLAMLQYIVPTLQAGGYTFVRVDDVPDVRAVLPPCDPSCASCTGVNANQCRACAAGRYLSGTSCPVCDACAAGTYEVAACTPTADVQCVACDPSCATCSGAGAGACTACPVGAFLTAGGACKVCSVCAAGAVQTGACTTTADTTCAPCSPGSYSASPASLACVPCAEGSFAADAGAAACSPCAPGTNAAGTGQSACTACAAGQVSDGGAATCSACAPGSAAPSSSTACQPCAPGTFAAAGAGACTVCSAGTISSAGAGSCTECPAGSIASSAGMSACTTCGAGTSAASPGSAACAPCASGTYAAAGATYCTACGSCDDGQACTVDDCDPTVGCTHTTTPRCLADGGATDGSRPAMDGRPDDGSRPTTDGRVADGRRPATDGRVADAGGLAADGSDATSAQRDAGPDSTGDATLTRASADAGGPGVVDQGGGCAVGPAAPVDGGLLACGALVVGLRRRRRASPGDTREAGR